MLRLIYNKYIHTPAMRIFMLIVFVLFGHNISAQHNILDYQNKNNPLFFNPAFNVNDVQFEGTVMPVSATSFELNLPFSLSDIFSKENDMNIIDMNRLYKRAGKENALMLNSTLSFIRFSGHWLDAKWGFQVYENLTAAASFEKNVIKLINKGNGDFISEPFITNIPFSVKNYTTWQLSYSKELNDKLLFGVAAKLYFGKNGINADANVSIVTDSLYDYIDIGLEGNVLASGPVDLSVNDAGFVNGIELHSDYSLSDYLFQFRNPGLGMDFGIEYEYDPRLKFSASIIDLGFITWLTDNFNINIDGKSRWNGLEISNLVNFPKDETVIEDLENISIADTLFYSAMTPGDDLFASVTPVKLYLAAEYKYDKKISLYAVNRLTFIDKFIDESLLISGDYYLNNYWTLSAGLNLTNRSYFNIPFGISFKSESIRFSISTNNLWGLAFSSYSRTFGGSINLAFNINGASQLEKDMMKVFPFFRPYKRWMGNK